MDDTCTNPGQHPLHLCLLKRQGRFEDIEKRSRAPVFVCHNCNALADHAADLCNPGALPVSPAGRKGPPSGD